MNVPNAEAMRYRFKQGEVDVLIAAHNEEDILPRALTGLAMQSIAVRPIVIDNASTDRTAEIAEAHGATVLHEDRPGKMRAIQAGLRFVADESDSFQEKRTLLFTDADARPVRWWSDYMSNSARNSSANGLSRPSILTGAVFYSGARNLEQLVANRLRDVYANGKNLVLPIFGYPPMARGHNMAIFDANDGRVLEELLAIPNYFPGEDLAIQDAILELGGKANRTFDYRSIVVTSGDRYPDLKTAFQRLRRGRKVQDEVYGNGENGRIGYFPKKELRKAKHT